MIRNWMFTTIGLALIFGIPLAHDTAEAKATMGEVVVTATRTETELSKVGGSSVTLVTAADIKAKAQTSIEAVLRSIAGVDVVATGGPGSQCSVFIRGADSKNSLVLIDGIMVNDVSSTNRLADLANLNVDNIERIEVVRGPLSALYGSNATAGVINIITKKGRGKPSAYIAGEYGSYNTWKTSGGFSGQWQILNFSLSASRTQSDGFSSANGRNDDIAHSGNTSEKDGWVNTTFSGKFGLDITSDFQVNGVVRYIDARVDIDDSSGYAADQWDFSTWPAATLVPDGQKNQKNESNQLLYKIEVHNSLFDHIFDSRFFYKGVRQDRDIFDASGTLTNNYLGQSMEAGWQGGLTLVEFNTLSFGYTYFKEKLDQTDSTQKEADNHSYWVSDQLFLFEEKFVVVGSVRLDDHDRFGSHVTWHVAPSLRIDKTGTTFKGSYGTGFRAPSLYELFADSLLPWFLGGNQNLKPEKSTGWEVGFEQILFTEKIRFGATYFDIKYEDRIEYVTDPTTYTSTYENLSGTTTTRGVESFVAYVPIKDLSFRLSHTFTETHDPDGLDLVRRPKHKVQFNGRYRMLDKLVFNLDVFYVGKRRASASAVDQNGNSISTLPDYFLVNVAVSYDINKHVQLFGRVDNVLNYFYEEAWSYATPGLSFFGGIRILLGG